MNDTVLSQSSSTQQLADPNTWIALDAPEEWASFSLAHDEKSGEWESRLKIEGMHCAACAINIEKALNAVPGVLSCSINAVSGRASLVWSADITKPSDWMGAISKVGYAAIPASDAFMQDSRRKNQRLALWRWLVAGFCMMQVMMYAYPTYVANSGDMSADMLNLLRWASWILTLPVMLFSCGPFFKNALNDLKQLQISMDLPVSLGIVITFLVSTAATLDPQGWWGHEVYFDSLTMFVFFLLTGRWIELRMRDRTAGALDVLMQRIPNSVARIKADGSVERISVHRLFVNDVVQIVAGESFPADGTIISGNTSADEALLTGESRPVAKTVGTEVIAGSHNLSATVLVRVDKIGQSTRYAQIVALIERAAIDKPRLALLADRIARPFLLAVLIAAAATAAILWQLDHSRAMMAAVAVLIVTCPCALSLATPAAMLTASGALARSGVLVRRMQALEALSSIDTVVFDKTGTLTQNKMQVANIFTDAAYSELQALQMATKLAQHSLHPASRALVEASSKVSLPNEDYQIKNVQEIAGFGLQADSIYGSLKLGSEKFCGLQNKLFNRSNINALEDGLTVHLVSEQGWIASFEIAESVKPDAVSTIQSLLSSGILVELLSGDRVQSVEKVAKIVGIDCMRANCTPQDKLAHIQTLQQQGHKTAMVGDGLNDGPVLAIANVSIAMGQAVPLAQAQSDFVVMSGQLSILPRLITQAKRTMRIVKQNLLWAAVYNATCVPLAVMGMLPAWLAGLGMALSSLLVIMNAARLSRLPLPEKT
ncbi:MAG: copper-translocating P-type ATPase [Methylotenera sp.]|nr:MAG: copper-translocating P-type ATPase [Methylotenera sp.]